MSQHISLMFKNTKQSVFCLFKAGTEVSALLGRMPSAVGYQPTLAEEMGVLQERITSKMCIRDRSWENHRDVTEM